MIDMDGPDPLRPLAISGRAAASRKAWRTRKRMAEARAEFQRQASESHDDCATTNTEETTT